MGALFKGLALIGHFEADIHVEYNINIFTLRDAFQLHMHILYNYHASHNL